ncbi:MAG: hypothetical protein KF784_05565 [Fimbriimonadaceae bacterium]|nr:hypothetical protein [Fimbriimonadaceae bacterium]
MTRKTFPKPVWYKNTYFWIAGILVVIAILGLPFLAGSEAIRDPGQKREGGLVLIYLGGAIVMLINGILSHRQTVKAYEEHLNDPDAAKPAKKPSKLETVEESAEKESVE